MKTCSVCKKTDLEVYFTPKGTQCQACKKEYNIKYRKQNQEDIAKQKKIYREENLEKEAENKKNYYQNNKEQFSEKFKIYREKNCEKLAEYQKEYQQNNKEKLSEYQKKYRQGNREKRNKRLSDKRKTDLEYKITCNLRSSFRIRLRRANAKKAADIFELTGCTINFLKDYLEKQFIENMSWENYGFGEDMWNIDHVRPLAKFDLTDIYQQRQAFHFSNLQPLWQPENREKFNKWDKYYQEWLWERKLFVYNE